MFDLIYFWFMVFNFFFLLGYLNGIRKDKKHINYGIAFIILIGLTVMGPVGTGVIIGSYYLLKG